MTKAKSTAKKEPEYVRVCKLFEGCRLDAYLDPGGIPTIGWGHTRTAKPGMRISQSQADNLLMQDLAGARASVRAYLKVALTPDQEDALTLLVFNIGSGHFARSTLLQLLNAGAFSGAIEQFALWRKAGGNVLKGLVVRRAAEQFVWFGHAKAITPDTLRALRSML